MVLEKEDSDNYELKRPGYRLQLRLENDQMECRADLDIIQEQEPAAEVAETEEPVSGENSPVTENGEVEVLCPAELLSFLQQHGITETIDFENLYSFCATAAEGVAQQDVLLATGIAPVSGEDGWFEMVVKAPGDQAEYEEDEKGNVDLRTLHSCTEIEVDQKLGRVHPPKNGVSGVTANGLAIPAEGGKPFGLIAGAGVVLKYDDRIAIAERAGRAVLEKQTLSVVDEMVISGDLDLKVGNIDFHGFVEIKGDVPDEFNVKATKGMRIAGTIGACRLESGGSMEIGSMAGKDIGQIVCHGDLKASYLNQMTLTCYGNVVVSNEIRNSQIKATGHIIVERGSIIGGKYVALDGIEAKVLGATSCVRTQLIAGVYFPDADRFDYLQQRLEEIDSQLRSVYEVLDSLTRLKERDETLVSAAEVRLSILDVQREKLEQEKEQLTAEMGASKAQVFSSCNPKINGLTAIHEGVIACLGQTVEKIKAEISGPLTLIENSREGGLRFLSLSPLIQQAAEVEEQILEDEPIDDELGAAAGEWSEPEGELPGAEPGWSDPDEEIATPEEPLPDSEGN